ncbi:arylsulfotransferase family protein [Halorientalis litorea]|uniref:arylsulfotransferase family protein n=1 Tax=Halorientalis litorea TaxID=2931977 RepID=UPI001FF32D4A|nr:arylsulfotransferase family protein [Halorientalis litorea]
MRQHYLRVAFFGLLAISIIMLGISYVTAEPPVQYQSDISGSEVAPSNNNWTVFTSHGFTQTTNSSLTAIGDDGRVQYFNNTYHTYMDVDPSPEGKYTVQYVAVEQLPAEECGGARICYKNIIERVNITTDETTRLYEEVRPGPTQHDPRWHDVDRVNETHYLVGDIQHDAVTLMNISNQMIVWEWRAQSHYSTRSGGDFPETWTHLNDVEVLPDGRFMASMRNQDEVVFLTRSGGVQEKWTLGEDGNHSILYEQHNPDYIPRSEGGPAVIVSDSENDRVIEYERQNGQWEQTWVWQDEQMNWPRDADRLPNGHTLITDTSGGRILEVNASGDIVWSVSVKSPYEAERLGTGDESQNGPAASSTRLESKTVERTAKQGLWPQFRAQFTDWLPAKLIHGIAFVTPYWMGFEQVGLVALAFVTLVSWIFLEIWWSGWKFRNPVVRQ